MIWVVIVSFILSFVLAFGLGANDVSNAFATSIGANIISLKTACLIASIAEMAGSVALGGLVTERIREATLQASVLEDYQEMIGMMCCLLAVATWLIVATWFKLPVSTTHAVFSSIVGFCLVANAKAIQWAFLTNMIIAWVTAPLLSGIVSVIMFFILAYFILSKPNSYATGLRAIPFIYMLTIAVNLVLTVVQILKKVYPGKTADYPSFGMVVGICVGGVVLLSALTYLLALRYIVPYIKRQVTLKFGPAVAATSGAGGGPDDKENALQHGASSLDEKDTKDLKGSAVSLKEGHQEAAALTNSELIAKQTESLFSFLQILSAIFTSFAHGSNDVSNSIGPLYAMYNSYRRYEGEDPITSSSPIMYGLLAYGGVGMVIGLYVWGSRVIETIGKNLTTLSPSRGFAIELGSALTVLIASMFGFSVSTTHCKVGSIVAVGYCSHFIAKKMAITIPMLTVSPAATAPVEQTVVSSPTVKEAALASANLELGAPTDSAHLAEESIAMLSDHEIKKESLVNWKLLLNIILSWVFTIPITGLMGAGFYALFILTVTPGSQTS